MAYSGEERRKTQRIEARFIVSYRIFEEIDNIDISQTKNMSLGGMMLTTNRMFEQGTNLAIEIRLPFDVHPIMIIAKVIESKEITKNLIYDTRLMFVAVDEQHRGPMRQTVDYYIRKGKK